MKLSIKQFVKIDPLKSFTELPIVRLIIVSLTFIALLSAVIIAFNSNLQFRFDYIGFNSFVEIFKVPLSVLAIIITVIAILATAHRSAQTKQQILITSKQNAFLNYFKHVEEFEKYLSTTIPTKLVMMDNLQLTHKYLFPNSIYGDYSVNKDFLSTIEDEFFKCKILLQKFNNDRDETVFKLLFNIYSIIDRSFSLLQMKNKRSGRVEVQDGIRIVVPSTNIKDIIAEIKNSAFILIQILSFDQGVSIPNSLKNVYNLEISIVPEWDFSSKNKFNNFLLFDDEK